jgi:acyl-CoA dehydrogenase
MFLFHPREHQREHADPFSEQIVQKTIAFFESKGLARIKADDQAKTWYEDFLTFVRGEKPFAALLTPSAYGGPDCRWDMWRLSEYNEVLGFYGLCYWYTWQVTILGLGPIWMGDNEQAKHRAAALLDQGGVFGFGLSERDHGADIYATEMALHPQPDGTFVARGSKYYIGNGNCAALVSTFGKIAGTDEYVFFTVRTDHERYECVKKIDTSGVRQAYVAEFALHDYPVTDTDILSRGKLAWESSLNTVNIGKVQLGFASIGIATHCLYEALHHAANRHLYGHPVTDFPHVRRELTEAYCRLVGMKLFALRAADYMRSASDQDRRYLLFNPIVKMKVTSQGEKVVALLHDVIAAKGYEQDTYFEMAIRDIGMLPKLEGTEHVNMALIIKFIKNYFFGPVEYPEVPRRLDPVDDTYLFHQHTGKLGSVRFPDYRLAYRGVELPNVNVFHEQLETFRQVLLQAPPTAEQAQDVDYMLAAGELFTLLAYAQLILENARIYGINDDVVDTLFAILVKDFSARALTMIVEYDNTDDQEQLFRAMIRKPHPDPEQSRRVWQEHVAPLCGSYVMSP